jgi:hypothetical protein
MRVSWQNIGPNSDTIVSRRLLRIAMPGQVDNAGSACKWEGETLVLPRLAVNDFNTTPLLLEVHLIHDGCLQRFMKLIQ